ncbi:Lrp/AsnC family transcriptional regulator [Draconibacterium sediminis]|uniref:Lrp/AsnC family transcriptional regulator n=1 Tax=Draconibacterium sediminis TaxID=1544798 RepID=UPI0026F2CEFC|nr:Lrp/AsnC family transcriptional regulator [Draconibacterium sediminis]
MVDILDYKILEILQENNLIPQRDIGDAIGLSAPAVQRRIKKMRESGIIEKDVSIINRDMLGNTITIIVEVFLDSEKLEHILTIKNEFSVVAEIQQCYYVTGESDFFLVMVVSSMKEYEELSKKLFIDNSNIKRFRTIVSMGIDKTSLKIPLSNKLG